MGRFSDDPILTILHARHERLKKELEAHREWMAPIEKEIAEVVRAIQLREIEIRDRPQQ